MITTPKSSADTLAVVPNVEAALDAVSPASILITEHEVALATAAAVSVPPSTTRGWMQAIHAVRTVASWRLRTSRADSRPARRHFPRHYTYVENALMSREMDRL